MLALPVVDRENRPSGTVEVEEHVFKAPENRSLVYRAVVMQRACARQGTSATRGRGEVSGSGKKPWKQKHTGRARAGSNRSPIWRHGGTVFGPQPRDYGFQLPKKVYRSALRSALSSKVSSGDVVVLSEISLAEPKTRFLVKFLSQFGLSGKTLLVVGEEYVNLERLVRNLKDVKIATAKELNVYDVAPV